MPSVKYMSCVLGTRDETKTDEFSTKFQMAFELPRQNHIAIFFRKALF